jgi:hypothetical protein
MLKRWIIVVAALAFTVAGHLASIPRARATQGNARPAPTKTASPVPTMTSVPTTSGGTVPTPKGAEMTAEGGNPQKGTTPTGSVNFWITGGHGHWCRGYGICFIKSHDSGPTGCEGARVKPEGDNVYEGVGSIDKKFLTLEFTTGPAERHESLPIDDDIVLDKCTSNSLGYGSVTVLKGTYRVSYDGSKYGKVSLRYKAQPLDDRKR